MNVRYLGQNAISFDQFISSGKMKNLPNFNALVSFMWFCGSIVFWEKRLFFDLADRPRREGNRTPATTRLA
jgi:hypothetical protein